MRILIDECVDERFRRCLSEHDCQTTRFAGMAGLKNGKLLDAAEAAGFDVLVTVDQHIPDQQSFAERRIALLILRAATNRLRDLEPLLPQVNSALTSLQPGAILKIGPG
jgi:predicted nuclease of predicted toxin-antitoxin system